MTSTSDLRSAGPAGARIEDQLDWYDRKSILALRKYKTLKLL